MNLLWKNKNFFILFLGRTVTNIGDSLYYIAAMWLVYQLGGSSFYTGIAGFLILMPMSLQFLTGPLVDRWSIKKTLVVSELLLFILILVIPIAYFLGFLTVQMVLIIVPLAAFIEQFTNPSEKKALPLILEKSELVKGNSLFSFAYQGIDMIFNAVGGALVALVGSITLYITDSITFALTAGLFGLLTLPATKKLSNKTKTESRINVKTYFVDLKEGFAIVFHSLLAIFLIAPVIGNFAVGASMAVLPSFSNYKGGAEIYGLFLAAEATGVLLGSLLASWIARFRVGYFSIAAFAIGAGCWVCAAIVPSSIVDILLFGMAWIPIGAINVVLGSVNQSVIPGRILARVSSVIYSVTAAAMPIGSLLGGYLATVFGSVVIFAAAGSGLLITSIIWAVHPRLRRLPSVEDMKPSTFNLNFEEDKKISY